MLKVDRVGRMGKHVLIFSSLRPAIQRLNPGLFERSFQQLSDAAISFLRLFGSLPPKQH